MKNSGVNKARSTPKNWTLSEEEKLNFESLYILYLITEQKVIFPIYLGGNLSFAEKAIDFLEKKKLIFKNEQHIEGKKILGLPVEKSDINWTYKATNEAKEIVKKHRKKFREFLSFYDVFAHVDPESGSFAFQKIKKILLQEGGKKAWENYKNHERWIDYRVPVVLYKGFDPREFIFFSFMEEGQFIPSANDEEHKWAINLFKGDLWEALKNVVSSAPIWEEQGDEENPANEIMETMIIQGAEVLKKQRAKLKNFIKKQDGLIGLEEELELLEKDNDPINDDSDDYYEDYYKDPVNYHGSYYYRSLSDPLFWKTSKEQA